MIIGHRNAGGAPDNGSARLGPVRIRFKPCSLSLLALAAAVVCAAEPGAAEPPATLVFGGDRANPPYEWQQNGAARGFAVDLARAIARAGDVEAEHRLSDWSEALDALEAGEVDVVTMFQSPEREDRFLFTPPFHFVHHAAFGRDDSPSVTTPADLEGTRTVVERSSITQARLTAEVPGIELLEESSALRALAAVREHRADYVILPIEMAGSLLNHGDTEIRQVSPALWSLGFAFAVPKDNRELAGWLTERYYEVVRAGTYEDLYARWERQLDPIAESRGSRLLHILALPSLLLALIGIAVATKLRRAVIYRSRALAEESKRRHEAETRVRWLTEHDADTEVSRLPHFAAEVDRLLAADRFDGSRKQIVALKLSDFDKVSHSHGHEAAMMLVRNFSKWLRSLRFQACGQNGRGTFLIFDDRLKIVTNLALLASPDDTGFFKLAQDRPRFFAGAASCDAHSRTATELIRRAETALAKAVEDREPWLDYRPSMEPDEAGLELIELFRSTAGEGIYPLFQPQVDIRTGQLVGAEALARWNAPGLGNISPAQFVPLIEDAGLIRYVTRRMLQDSIRVSARLRGEGFPCPISVNVTVPDLLSPKLLTRLRAQIEAHDGLLEDLKLELTETSFAKNSDALIWSMMRLQSEGISMSIDDFGTGYSSLAYLSDLPVRELKIDRSFVDGMTANAKSKSIVRTTIQMGHELELSVVAEGVETQTQLEMLRALGCDRVQGYFVAKPMLEEDFMRFVAANFGTQRKATGQQ